MPDISIKIEPETNLIKCEITPKNSILVDFFESDIQGDTAFIHFLYQSIDKLTNDIFEINGNAHNLSLSKSVYKVTPLYDTSNTWVMGPISDFTFFLAEWEKILSSHKAS
ncbi:hypothetical protein NBZ79_11400 [Sneathiella marina]|uniref:Uncharacterized protein n=1 Tax=Sneathiella marina TaxID=2950108 RepID=A0ABY4W132_9PROT|nr:hypothetical protein [Sneathiella marina]USG59783.1 hypothetical protein NBZ79_11400 [Sneathiella marina]